MHINLSFPPVAAVTLLSHIPSPGHPPMWLSAQLPPGRADLPVTRPPMTFGDALGKLCLLALGATARAGLPPLGTESPLRGGTRSRFSPPRLFCIQLAVPSTGSCQRRSLPPPLLVDGTCSHPGFPSESGRQGIPQPRTTEGGHSPFCPYSPLWSGRWECRGATF